MSLAALQYPPESKQSMVEDEIILFGLLKFFTEIGPRLPMRVQHMVTDTNKSTDIGHRLPIRGEHMVTVKHCIDENKLSLTSVVMSTNRSRAIGNRFPITMQQHLNECSTVMVNM